MCQARLTDMSIQIDLDDRGVCCMAGCSSWWKARRVEHSKGGNGMDSDVTVVGAGPVGLLLACELARGGVRVILIDRLREPSTVPKANGLVGRIVPVMRRRGYLRLMRGDHPRQLSRFQFGPLPVRLGALRGRLHVLPVPQQRLEAVLIRHAEELGVDIRRGVEVTNVSQDENGVLVFSGAATVQSRYAVGCDGAHSIIRKRLGIDFEGETSNRITTIARIAMRPEDASVVNGELRLQAGERFALFRPSHTERGAVTFAPAQSLDAQSSCDEYVVAIAQARDPLLGEHDPSFEELQESARDVLGFDLPILSAHSMRRTVANSRQAMRYRARRVFLAGDAAHVFNAGGSALNVGMLDAFDLAVRMVAVIRDRAPASELDGYERTRHAAGRQALQQTRAQAALGAFGSEGVALREVLSGLLTSRRPRRYLARLLNGD